MTPPTSPPITTATVTFAAEIEEPPVDALECIEAVYALADPDHAIHYLTEVQEAIELERWRPAYEVALGLVSSLGQLAGVLEGALYFCKEKSAG